jgi:EAL domain-containing protein (putative c-di-GMP-specific phosphodiesterase class I)
VAHLRQLPIDIPKIDRAFIRNSTGGPEKSALAHAIIKLAGLFGLSTVGEGIENAEQLPPLV